MMNSHNPTYTFPVGKILAALLLLMAAGLKAQPYGADPPRFEEDTTEFQIIFKVNSSTIDPSLNDNAAQINHAIRFLRQMKDNPRVEIVNVTFCGSASPEGSAQNNRKLATRRLKAIEALVRGQIDLPDSVVTYDDAYIPWNWLRDQVAKSDLPEKQEVLAIIAEKPEMVKYGPGSSQTIDERVRQLQALDGGRVWKKLFADYFSRMRTGAAVIVTAHELPPPPPPAPAPEPEPVVEEPVVEEVIVEEVVELPAPEEPDDWYRKMYIKTNVPAWALLWQNVAVEVDLARHWSFALPVYWSPYNYGKQTLKFRTLTLMPEFRYWPKADNMGFFVNAHFGLAYFNYAKDGEYRYQDHAGKTPAIGGGLGVGYRFYFCKNRHWTMEVAVGGGIYKLDYDVFLNTPNTNHGYLLRREKRTFYGLDQAALTLSYSFGLRKKGGDK